MPVHNLLHNTTLRSVDNNKSGKQGSSTRDGHGPTRFRSLTVGSCPYASTRASRVHLPATRRTARVRSAGGVCWMMLHA